MSQGCMKQSFSIMQKLYIRIFLWFILNTQQINKLKGNSREQKAFQKML